MTDTNARFVGSIPENYDRHLGSVLFEPYAADLARQLDVKDGARVLEIACGTGISTRHLRNRIPAGASLVATDLNQPMIDLASRKLQGVPGIDWQQADACALPFPDKAFDVAVCQFGLMFVPDKPQALREARRVLADGGTLLFSVWDSLERNTFAKTAHEKIASFFPSDPPTFYQVPFSLYDTGALKEMARGTGFTDVRIEPVAFQGESPSALDLATGLVEGNPVGSMIRERKVAPVAEIIEAVATIVAQKFGDRPVRIPLHAFVMTARAGAR